MSDKVFNWEKRQPTKYSWGANAAQHLVYFFRSSFEECTGKTIKALAQDMIAKSENKYEIVHTPDAQSLIVRYSEEPLQDPLLKAVFGPNSRLEQKALLDFYEGTVGEKDGMAFVDLCVVLGELERANKFAKSSGKEFEILKALNYSEGKTEVLRHAAIKLWLEKAPKNLPAARLTSLVHRLVESTDGESRLRVISELWGEGFHWDAMCLVAVLMPEEPAFDFMKDNIQQFLKHKECNFFLDIVQALKAADTRKEGPVTVHENEHLKQLDALSVYRLVKIDICRNEKDSKTSDIEKLGVRAKCSDALRLVLLTAFTKLGPVEAKAIAEDIMGYLKKNFPNALADYFPNAERMLFDKFIGMVADLHSAVGFVLNVTSSSTVDLGKATKTDFTNIIMAKWRNDYADIWSSTGVWQRHSFAKTCLGLMNHLIALDNLLGASYASKMLKLTLRMCWMFASPDFVPTKAGRPVFRSLAKDFGINDDQAEKIAKAFAYVKHKEVVELAAAPSTPPVHLTPDQLITNIKKQGIATPPLPSEAIPVVPPTKALSTVAPEDQVTEPVAVSSAISVKALEEPVEKKKAVETKVEENIEEEPQREEKIQEVPVEEAVVPEETQEVPVEKKDEKIVEEKPQQLVQEEKIEETKPTKSEEVVASGVQRVVAREDVPASESILGPVLDIQFSPGVLEKMGKAITIVSEDGVTCIKILEEMETQWEAPPQQVAADAAAPPASASQESVPPLAEGSSSVVSAVDTEVSKAADSDSVVQEQHAAETSSEAASVANTTADVTTNSEGSLHEAEKVQPPSDSVPPSSQATSIVAQAPAPNALDALLASGDARSTTEGSDSKINVATRSSSSGFSGCPEDVAGASVRPVSGFGSVAPPAFSASSPVVSTNPPATPKFNIGGFETGGGAFGSFGEGFGSGGGSSGGGGNVGFGQSALGGGNRFGQSGGGGHHGGGGGHYGGPGGRQGGGSGSYHGGNGGGQHGGSGGRGYQGENGGGHHGGGGFGGHGRGGDGARRGGGDRRGFGGQQRQF